LRGKEEEMPFEELKRQIQVLGDLEAIRQLKARYAQVVDGFLNQDIEKLFTEDAVLDFTPRDILKGRQAIKEFFRKIPEFQPFSIHYFVLPDIKVEGEKAQGRWYMWLPATKGDGSAIWVAGYEDDMYVKVDGEWLISEVKLTRCFRTPYEEGWHKKRFAD
jgi:ketosteroid isomerase-like protein